MISLSQPPSARIAPRPERVTALPSASFLYGKVLNALMLDRVERDLIQMRVINALLEAGSEAYGQDFEERIGVAVAGERGRRFRRIRDLVIRPSRDLGEVAGECAESVPRRALPWWARSLLGAVEADTLSYLYFDRTYTEPLVDLGFADAEAMEEELVGFFGENP